MQLDVHDTKRRIERAYESIRKNQALPENEKQKLFAFKGCSRCGHINLPLASSA